MAMVYNPPLMHPLIKIKINIYRLQKNFELTFLINEKFVSPVTGVKSWILFQLFIKGEIFAFFNWSKSNNFQLI